MGEGVQSGQCRGRPRAGRALPPTCVVGMSVGVNPLAMAWPRNACGASRAAYAAQGQACTGFAGTRGEWGVLFSLFMMSYAVSILSILYKSYLRLAGSSPEPQPRVWHGQTSCPETSMALMVTTLSTDHCVGGRSGEPNTL